MNVCQSSCFSLSYLCLKQGMARNKGNQKGEEDVDQHFLDQVLNQIYDFGKYVVNGKLS